MRFPKQSWPQCAGLAVLKWDCGWFGTTHARRHPAQQKDQTSMTAHALVSDTSAGSPDGELTNAIPLYGHPCLGLCHHAINLILTHLCATNFGLDANI